MKIEDLTHRPARWLMLEEGEEIAVSSRVRLARNIRGEVFPHRATEQDRIRLWSRLHPAVSGLASAGRTATLDMGELNWSEKHVLRERHLISVEQSEKGKGSGLVLREDESVAVMVNEEDHLRLQAMEPGLRLDNVWKTLDAVDTELGRNVPYAFSRRLGYLTACPSNVGTGMRASVMMHLPAVGLMNEVEPIIKGLTRIGVAVRGLLGEGTEASGNMYQVSNQTTLGETEEQIINRLNGIVLEIAEHEKNARLRLLEQRRVHLMDYVGRAFGVLLSAHLLSSREMLDLLSALRLGLDMGLVRNVSAGLIHELMLLTQPGHMQIMLSRELSPDERDQMRARLVRDKLARITVEK